MTTEVAVSESESLIGNLDPTRDYGERSYEQVVAEVRAGALILRPGRFGLPMISDAATGMRIKGSSNPPIPGELSPRDWSMAEFRRRAADNFDQAWKWLIKGMDPDTNKNAHQFHKIYWEQLIGKAGESRGQLMDAVAVALLEAAKASRSSTVTADVLDGEYRDAG